MASYTGNTAGAPTGGFFQKGDFYTDVNGAVFTCVLGGFACIPGLVMSNQAVWSPAPAPLDQMGGSMLYTTQNALVAHAGGGQAAAIADAAASITADIARITTVASAADSVALPAALKGRCVTVNNAAAANSMNVFPQVGDAINALGANAAFAMAANKSAEFTCAVAGQWHAVLTA
jgi:hypothetical protein